MPTTTSKETDAYAIVRTQAKVRVVFGLPIGVLGAYFLIAGGAGFWVPLIAGANISYIVFIAYCANSKKIVSPEKLALITAVLDPALMHSSWIAAIGEYGGLMAGFYLFTIMGFGFRSGVKLMRICQVSAIVGFTGVMVSGLFSSSGSSFWLQHPVIWVSFLLMLILVPGYASVLIKKLHEARTEAEHESQAKSQLLARVSHELRTPLTGIVAAAQLMLLESKNSGTSRRAESILGMAKELTAEIEDLLDQAKYESDALALEATPVSIHELMERVRLSVEPAAARKGLELNLSVDPEIVDWVITDPHYLGRALLNLSGNAVKFTPSGRIRVQAKLLEQSQTNYSIRFEVEDTGIGIAKEFHNKIFEPFYQVAGGTTRRFGGTGLGMAIAWEVVRAMGGKISIDSQEGYGTQFHFDLCFPRIHSPLQEAVNKVPATETVLSKRILVVDDHETNLLLLKELLEQDRHEVSTAMTAMEALSQLNAKDFDLAFFDFNLTDMDGAKLLQIYRFGKLKPAPVFFLTADATLVTSEKLLNTGANGVLNKPVSIHDLRKAIAKVCQNRPQTDVELAKPATPRGDRGDRSHIRPVPVQLLDKSRIENLREESSRPGFMRALLTQARSDIDMNCQLLGQSLRNADVEAMRESAHALKGVCANIGAVRLVGLSSSLMAIRREDIKQPERLIADIETARSATDAAISQVIDELDDSGQNPDLSAILH